jgi:hypothetical protein
MVTIEHSGFVHLHHKGKIQHFAFFFQDFFGKSKNGQFWNVQFGNF